MNDKLKTPTTATGTNGPILWNVRFKYVQNNRIRSGNYVCEAKTPEEAKAIATAGLASEDIAHAKIGAATPY